MKFLTMLLALTLPLAAGASKPAGTVVAAMGKVTLITGKSETGKSLKAGQTVMAGDRIKTGANGRAEIVLLDGTRLKVNYLTDITLRDTDSKGKASERGIGSIKIALGEIWAKVTKKNSRLEFESPAAVAAVKGTEPILSVSEGGDLCAKLKEGKMEISAPGSGSCVAMLNALQQICVGKNVGTVACKPTAWDGAGTEWTAQVGGPSDAEVVIKAVDTDGVEKQIELQYGPK